VGSPHTANRLSVPLSGRSTKERANYATFGGNRPPRLNVTTTAAYIVPRTQKERVADLWLRGNAGAEATSLGALMERSVGRWRGGGCAGGLHVSDAQPVSADYYREKAEEIRHFARRCRFLEIGEQLFQLADYFDRMAAAVKKRQRITTLTRRPS
jgi:hypothetical protein